MPGGIDGALKPGLSYPLGEHKGVQAERPETPRKGSSDFDAVFTALLVCFHEVDQVTVKSWTEELFARLAPPELDLRIDVGRTDSGGKPISPEQREKNKAFARCVQEMETTAWEALQNCATSGGRIGIRLVSIGKSVDVNSRVARGLGKLNVEVLTLDRDISDSLKLRLKKAGVSAQVRQAPKPETAAAASAAQEEATRLRLQRAATHVARQDFANARMENADHAQRVTGNLITVAHESWSKVDRPIMKRLAQEICKGNVSGVRGMMRAVLPRESPLGIPRKVDLLMARGPSQAVRTRDEPPGAATEMKTPKLLGDMLEPGERSRLEKHVEARRKVFIPELSAFVEEPELPAAEEQAPADFEPPMLHRLCGDLPPDSYDQFEAMGAYVDEILNSDLPRDQREALCVSTHAGARGEASAVRRALDVGNPGAAAAIMLAIMESDNWALAAAILPKLGVSPQEVVDALKAGPFRQIPWCATAIGRLNAAAAGLKILEGGVAVKLNYGPKAVLRAHSMWNRTGKLVCSSEKAVPALQYHQPSGDDHDKLKGLGAYVYLVDPDKLTRA